MTDQQKEESVLVAVLKRMASNWRSALVALAAFAIVIGALLFFSARSINDMQQQRLTDEYSEAAFVLGGCKSAIAQAAGIVSPDEQARADEVLGKIAGGDYGVQVKMRYQEVWDALGAIRPLSSDTRMHVLLAAADCQRNFFAEHSELHAALEDYDGWNSKNRIGSYLGGGVDDRLYISQPGFCQRGKEALKFMRRPIAELARETRWDALPDDTPGCNSGGDD